MTDQIVRYSVRLDVSVTVPNVPEHLEEIEREEWAAEHADKIVRAYGETVRADGDPMLAVVAETDVLEWYENAEVQS